MKFHYAGKYDGNEDSLPKRDHASNYVPFKEPDMKKLAVVANVGACITMLVLLIPFIYFGRTYFTSRICMAPILSLFVLIPHEFLHAIWFQGDVYMYENLKQGLLFVVGTEDMSKARFILMSLCPNVVFGFFPYIVFLIHPEWSWLGLFGLVCIGEGFGDYINVFNALTQMPNNALTYLNGMHSFWYIPNDK